MKPPDLIAAVLTAPAVAWYLFSADTPGDFFWRGITIAGLTVLVWLGTICKMPPSLIEQEFGEPEKRD